MRRFLLVTGLALVAILPLGLLALGATDRPLPWRGALTRRAWGEVRRGELPGLACERAELMNRPSFIDRLPVMGRFACLAIDSARSSRVELLIDEGWVVEVKRSWQRPPATGRALVDSIASAADSTEGVRCHASEARNGPSYLRRSASWLAIDGVATELHADSGSSRFRDSDAWEVTLTRHYRFRGCPGR